MNYIFISPIMYFFSNSA